MPYKMRNPHDKFFKETFSYPEVVGDFVKHYLPEEILAIIDVTTITPLKDSFIQKELEEFYSDLLFEVNFRERKGYLYFLFEHKSYKDKTIAFQLWSYMGEVWGQQIEKERAKSLAPILPVVFYHGKEPWEAPKTLVDWFERDDVVAFQPFIPQFEFLFFNIASLGDRELVDTVKLKVYLEIMRSMYTEDLEALYATIAELDRANEPSYFETVILYVFNVGKSISEDKLKERLTMEGRKKYMTIAEKLKRKGEAIGIRKGEAIGIRKGEAIGMQKTLMDIVQNMLLLGKSEAEIMQITGLSEEEINKIIAKINR